MPEKDERRILAALLAGQVASLVMLLGFFIFLYFVFLGIGWL